MSGSVYEVGGRGHTDRSSSEGGPGKKERVEKRWFNGRLLFSVGSSLKGKVKCTPVQALR